MAILRPTGAFVGAHGVYQSEKRTRQELVFRNCPALNTDIFEQIAAVYQNRWVFLESEAQRIFGEYYQPFLAARYLNRLTLPAPVALRISGSTLKATGNTAIVYPSPALISLLMWASSRLTFTVGFGLATVAPAPDTVGAPRVPKSYPPLWLRVQQLLLNPNSALHAALHAPPPPDRELDALASMFDLPAEGVLSERFVNRYGPPIDKEQWAGYFDKFSQVRASGALATPYQWVDDQVALVCSPTLVSTIFEYVVSRSAAPASDRQVYSAQHISLALSEAERREVIASVYGAMRRGEVQITNSGTFSAAPIKKIASTHWSTINAALTRPLLDQIMYPIFRGFDRPGWASDPGWCAPSGFLESSRWVVKPLRSLPQIRRMLQITAVLSDGTWADLEEISEALAAKLQGAYTFSGKDIEDHVSFASFLGWWCGIFDLAFELDAKGVKSKLRALRLNRAGMQKALCPEVPVKHLTFNDAPDALIVRPTHTSTVDVLPTGEILTPPDLDPLVRLCLATIFTYKGANTYTVPRFKGSHHLPLELTAADVEELLHVISRHTLPPSVLEQIRQLPSEPPPIGFYTPDFVLTNIDRQYAKRVLTMTGETPCLAVELSPSMWGFYQITTHRARSGLRYLEPSTVSYSPNNLKELLRNLERRDLWWQTDLKPLKKEGKIPIDPFADVQHRSVSDQPAVPDYTGVKEFFDVRPTDPDWIADTVGVEIFTLLPQAVRENTALGVALRPCVEMTTKVWPLSHMWEIDF
jgi:hypothetical protein